MLLFTDAEGQMQKWAVFPGEEKVFLVLLALPSPLGEFRDTWGLSAGVYPMQ